MMWHVASAICAVLWLDGGGFSDAVQADGAGAVPRASASIPDPRGADAPPETPETRVPLGEGILAPRAPGQSKTLVQAPWDTRTLLAVVTVLGTALVAAGVLKKFLARSRRGGHSGIDVLEKAFLSPKQSLALVRIGRRVMLVGVAPERISLLTTIRDPAEVDQLLANTAGGRTGQAHFGTLLIRETADYGPDESEATEEPIGEAPYRTVCQTQQDIKDLLKRVQSLNETVRPG